METIKTLSLLSMFCISVYVGVDGMNQAASIGEIRFNPTAIVADSDDAMESEDDFNDGCVQSYIDLGDGETEVSEECNQ